MPQQKNGAGFTLVELMLVIAVIAILAVVLVPAAAFMKQSAKEAGVETNIRTVEATAIGLLVKFPATPDGLAAFNQGMTQALDGNIRNPFTQSEQALPLVAAVPVTCVAGVQGVGSGTQGRDQTTTLFPGTGTVTPGNRGAVLFSAFLDAREGLVCHVWGYDGDGRILRGSSLAGVSGTAGPVGLTAADFANFILPSGGGMAGVLGFPGTTATRYTGSAGEILIPAFFDGVPLQGIYQDVFRFYSGGTPLTSVTFAPDSQLTHIHARAFQGNNLTELTLPNSVTRIDLRAFAGNDIRRITVGSNLATVENEAFANNQAGFVSAYHTGGAGTYVFADGAWTKE